eukprot:9481345-Pyramimonas_sp.AAC.1
MLGLRARWAQDSVAAGLTAAGLGECDNCAPRALSDDARRQGPTAKCIMGRRRMNTCLLRGFLRELEMMPNFHIHFAQSVRDKGLLDTSSGGRLRAVYI